MDRPIPDEIVACVQELAAALGAWCEQGRDRSLAKHEEAVLARVRAALPGLLGGVVRAGTSGLDPRLARARAACPTCGRKAAPADAEDEAATEVERTRESAARHVVQARMKRPGMRRSDPGARAMLALRARLRSDRPLTPTTRAAYPRLQQ